jgi:putative transposase
MVIMRRQHEAAFKAKVALEAVKGEKTIAQISSEFGIHPNQIRQWRRHLLEVLPDVFSDRRKKADRDRNELEDNLYRQIGQLKVELEWLKKNLSSSVRGEERFGRLGQYNDSDRKAV